MENGFVKIISPIDDTPAQRAGLESGDIILKLDNHPVKGMSLNAAIELMRGPKGSSIELTIAREGRNQPFSVTLERDIIRVVSVRKRWLEPGYAYVRIAQFQKGTGEDLGAALISLKDQEELKEQTHEHVRKRNDAHRADQKRRRPIAVAKLMAQQVGPLIRQPIEEVLRAAHSLADADARHNEKHDEHARLKYIRPGRAAHAPYTGVKHRHGRNNHGGRPERNPPIAQSMDRNATPHDSDHQVGNRVQQQQPQKKAPDPR